MTVNKVKDIKKLALGSVSDLYNKDANITLRDYLNKIKTPEYKSVSDLLKSEYASNNLAKQLAELQKNVGKIPSYKEHVEILQKQLGIGRYAQEQIAMLNTPALIRDSIRKQFSNRSILAEIGNEYRKHIEILQKLDKAYPPHDENIYKMLRRQVRVSMSLRNQSEMLNKQAGLNNMQEMLKNLRQNVTHKIDSNNEIKELLNKHFQEQNASFHQIMEQGLSTIAQAYIEGATETPCTKSDVQNKGLNKSNSAFVDSFKELPYPLQWLLMVIFSQVVFGAFIDYEKEKTLLGIHEAESYLISLFEDKPISKQQLIKENKEIRWEDLNGFRFITGNNVRLHVSPSVNSEVIECIGKNTIVAILDKKDRQWLFVQVKSGDEFITGWITRTYTKPLKA